MSLFVFAKYLHLKRWRIKIKWSSSLVSSISSRGDVAVAVVSQ